MIMAVPQAPVVGGDGARHQADHHHDEDRHHPHDERDPGAIDDTRGYVPPQLVSAEGMVHDGGCRLSAATVVVSIAMGSPSLSGAQRSAVTAITTTMNIQIESGQGQLVLAQAAAARRPAACDPCR